MTLRLSDLRIGRRGPTRRISSDTRQVQNLQAKHKEMIRLSMMGATPHDISLAIDLTPETIARYLRSPLVQEQIEALTGERDASAADVYEQLQKLVPEAIETHRSLMSSTDPRVTPETKLRAAESVLDRGGIPKARQVDSVSVTGSVKDLGLSQIRERAKALNILPVSASTGPPEEEEEEIEE